MDRIAILIPCYNESKTIGKVISEFRNELPDAVIYVYDNNSTDGTAEIAKKQVPWSDMSTSRAKGML